MDELLGPIQDWFKARNVACTYVASSPVPYLVIQGRVRSVAAKLRWGSLEASLVCVISPDRSYDLRYDDWHNNDRYDDWYAAPWTYYKFFGHEKVVAKQTNLFRILDLADPNVFDQVLTICNEDVIR